MFFKEFRRILLWLTKHEVKSRIQADDRLEHLNNEQGTNMDFLKKSDYYYDLPEELIAQDPLADRSSSRLMLLDKKTGEVEHTVFRKITEYLEPGDCLVINNTKVIPARLLGVKVDTGKDCDHADSEQKEHKGSPVEILLLKRLDANRWETIVKPGKKLRTGARVEFGNGRLAGRIEEVLESGNRIVYFEYDGIFEEILDALGTMPLPPYITHKLADPARYQTVYAKYDGSAAAPTAGLHFTPELLDEIRSKGIDIAEVTLHVGLGTFRPVKEDNILDHKMHSEYFVIPQEAADRINKAKASGHRVICVGTTSCRTIEAAAQGRYSSEDDEEDRSIQGSPEVTGNPEFTGSSEVTGSTENTNGSGFTGLLHACSGNTDIFIYPGYSFRVCDCLITNFHLPESTLIMLVSALAGREHVLEAYKKAVEERYRFFSFGDAMFIH